MTALLVAALLYLLTAVFIWRYPDTPSPSRWLPLPALIAHGVVLGMMILHHGSITLGLSEALSLFMWQSALLLWALCWRDKLQALGIGIYPAAALGALIAALDPTPPVMSDPLDWKTRLHVVLSLMSAGLLTLAAVNAVLLAIQDRWLHRLHFPRFARALPPLQTMEDVLFRLIGIGFALLSATLLSGLWFVRDWMAQHLAHKTILSITAWLIFGILLWGRARHGWRGRTAIRWALAGYAVLFLAYFGSKMILEEILGKHWG
ncbi:ABC-type uncharacterized transport system, permease component [Solimonas aquatica]|uniref:ABC-type uncharacterized transport system, permease component n=1 Tax=Solimonas aquatica TaxID=489703 RepID=A0A1H9ISH4_9GAMM|nr:cytochrome c biogenesis protein CcsA [Solimonas aquatica]SEQ77469.1 ABC-type uncharacterized transport system, permease component [Solimonas aquatica]